MQIFANFPQIFCKFPYYRLLTILLSLFKLKIINDKQIEKRQIVLVVFRNYLKLCRKIQTTYRLEPAGSHGVYGLDDYQFCCYIFGAAQLIGNKYDFRPNDFPIQSRSMNPEYKDKFMFLEAINFIHTVKTGPFSEHSNQLWNISGVERWEKINSGLIKMYDAEVLKKFPIVQHFYFGSVLTF